MPLSAPNNTIAVFVDVQNVYYTCRSAFSANFDYNALWADLSQHGEVVAAYAYAIDRGDEKQRQFQHILRAIGFEVKLKPFIQRTDGSAKGDWDVGITIDMLASVSQADILVLVSGDGDFALLVDTLRHTHHKTVWVYGTVPLTAKALMDAADKFIAIEAPLLL